MRKILMVLLMVAVLSLGGCGSWMDGSYVSVTLRPGRPDHAVRIKLYAAAQGAG